MRKYLRKNSFIDKRGDSFHNFIIKTSTGEQFKVKNLRVFICKTVCILKKRVKCLSTAGSSGLFSTKLMSKKKIIKIYTCSRNKKGEQNKLDIMRTKAAY